MRNDLISGTSIGDAGNTSGSASVIAGNRHDTVITGSVGSTDIDDYYKFVANASGTATFALTGLSQDIDLSLYNSSGTCIKQSLNFNSDTEWISYTVAAGSTYYIRVNPYYLAVSDYNLTVTLPTAAASTAPDLVVSRISAPVSVTQGANLSFSYVVTNQGSGAAVVHYAGISLDQQPSESSYLSYNNVSGLSAGATQTLTSSISTAGLSVGTHTLYIKEDFYGNYVSESNESNNVGYVTFNVTSAAATNRAPVVASPMSDLTWREGASTVFTVPAGTFADPDGNSLTYSAKLSTGAALPSWLSFNAATHVFSGTAPVGSPDYTVRVTATDTGGLSTYDDVNVFTVAGATGFNISVAYSGDQAYASYFNQAKAIWERVITGDLPDYMGVDDIAITAEVKYIDGAYNTLGQAGPRGFRTDANSLPYAGMMEFDSADMAMMLANGTLTAVITHEMGHVLGFGTLWGWDGFNTTFGRYTGRYALNEYRALSGNSNASYVPLEASTGSAGSDNSHWAENIFDTELMTPTSEHTNAMPLSRLTIAAMQDLGYAVNYAAADNYALLLASLVGVPSLETQSANLMLI